jgi:hypothetical protein
MIVTEFNAAANGTSISSGDQLLLKYKFVLNDGQLKWVISYKFAEKGIMIILPVCTMGVFYK